ncbi:hypothetical protein NDU88_000749 [Pleurodeles waltl]|uniref:Uncharacterized protein n=1 Tax=Pleurodeles waltl TaxID=8319 RepID=A0AAV7SXX4_PLEWA|nr:hypothetical protein NDU88_000749 [Pleurodeles waltl]
MVVGPHPLIANLLCCGCDTHNAVLDVPRCWNDSRDTVVNLYSSAWSDQAWHVCARAARDPAWLLRASPWPPDHASLYL